MCKVTFTIRFILIFLLVDACNCPEVEPYFDYNKLDIIQDENEVHNGDSVEFRVFVDDLVFLASSEYQGFLTSSALATQPCDDKGYRGVKFFLDSVSIMSSANWDSSHPAGERLNDIFYIEEWWDAEIEDYALLATVGVFPVSQYSYQNFQIRTSPTEDLKHVFTVTYYKSNGEIAQGQTDTITWVP